MAESKKLNLLDEELDEETQKYLEQSLEAWKEATTERIYEQMEKETQAKIEELNEENNAYREQLREEYADKMLEGLNELKESIRAEVTAEVIKNNPELKILEQIKEAVAPIMSEDYRDSAYSDTIAQLSEEVSSLRREAELNEGAQTLASLLSGYNDKTQKFIQSVIKEGSPDEIKEQFCSIVEAMSSIFEAEDDEDEDDSDDDKSEDEDDDKEAKGKKDDDEDDDEDESKDDDEDGVQEESYIEEGLSGEEPAKKAKKNYDSMMSILEEYSR